jgi:membrane associated rhomboid family serine protease
MIPIRDTIPSRCPPVATRLIILANVVVFGVQLALSPEHVKGLFYLFGVVPARYSFPEWARSVGFPIGSYWPFLTSIFLHGGWFHLISNMWALWIFGDNVEDRMGSVRFVIFYLLTGVIAGIAHWQFNPTSQLPTVGASGAIAGVMGAYLVLYPRATVITLIPIFFWPVFFEVPAITYLGFWVLLQIIQGTASLVGPESIGGVAWWAHLGGFASGLLLHQLFLIRRKKWRKLQSDELGLEGAWRCRHR